MIIAKVILLQAFWYLSVTFGPESQLMSVSLFIGAFVVAFSNFFLYKPEVSLAHYLFTLFVFILWGAFQDWALGVWGLIDYHHSLLPLWLLSLYVIFISYYGDLFNYLSTKNKMLLFILGGAGGLLAYVGGGKLAGLTIHSDYYYIFVFLSWGLFFPTSIRIFYEGYMWNRLLDASIYYSFDLSGYNRHAKYEQNFKDDLDFIKDGTCLITGGTSGIGYAAAEFLCEKGVKTIITGRNKEKGEKAAAELKGATFKNLDMIDWDGLKSFVSELPELHYLVLNAGGMPESFATNDKGVELQMASQLFGHYFLLKRLHEAGKLSKGARVVWVSSGGMYLMNLELETIFENPKYDKVATYANVKRAQVTLSQKFKEEFPDQIITTMHPGWVDTPGVRGAIPGFFDKMKDRLRNPLQGADTILWCLSDKAQVVSGGFYFDRKLVSPHLTFWTWKSERKADELYALLNKYYSA